MGLKQDVADRKRGDLEPLQHGGHGSYVTAILMLGGKWYGEERGVLYVVDADDSDVLWDVDTFGGQTGHDAGGD